jgi:hypothetical protein
MADFGGFGNVEEGDKQYWGRWSEREEEEEGGRATGSQSAGGNQRESKSLSGWGRDSERMSEYENARRRMEEEGRSGEGELA